MARIRTIKPEFWTDPKTGRLSGNATKLFIGIWNHCDDYGVIRFDIDQLRVLIFPYTTDPDEVASALLNEILPLGLVEMFTVIEDNEDSTSDRRSYLWVRNFTKHQKIDRPSLPVFPGWTKSTTPDTYVFPDARRILDESSNTRGSIDDHSTNPRSGRESKGGDLGEEGKGVEGSRREGNGEGDLNPVENVRPVENPPGSSLQAPTGLSRMGKAPLRGKALAEAKAAAKKLLGVEP